MEIDDKKDLIELTDFFSEACEKCKDWDEHCCCNKCYDKYAFMSNAKAPLDIIIEMDDIEYNLVLNNHKDKLERLKEEYHFDSKKGFLREDGCILPREERSTTCLSFLCQPARDYFRKKYDMAIDLFLEDLFKAITDYRNEEVNNIDR